MDKIKKILIIDDEIAFTEMVKLNLEESGRFHVRIENDSRQALQTAQEFSPDLILLDIIMPDIEGPDVAALFREDDQLSKIPIIYLTVTIRQDEAGEWDQSHGRSVFLAKPCSVDDLISAIDMYLP